jgi:hypothetical protein
MRSWRVVLQFCGWFVFGLLCNPVIGHEDECLDHHWLQPEYGAEIRYQLVWMAGLIFAAALWTIVQRRRRMN